MSTESDHKQLVRRDSEEIWGQGRYEIIPEILSPDHLLHSPASPEDIRGHSEYEEYVRRFRSAFSDMEIEILHLIAEDDRVFEHHLARGTHTGKLMDIPSTGNEVEIGGMVIYRFEDGRIAEAWAQADMMGLMRQIGALESGN